MPGAHTPYSGSEEGFKNNPKLACGQTGMLVEAYITQTSATASAYGLLYINGKFTSSSICGTASAPCSAKLTTVAALPSSVGLTQVCAKCSLQWTTAIAVPKGSDQIVPGSRFALAGCNPQLTWASVSEGYFTSAGSSATATVSAWSSTVAAQSPNNAVALGLIRLAPTNTSSNVTIGIDESGCISGRAQ